MLANRENKFLGGSELWPPCTCTVLSYGGCINTITGTGTTLF